MPLRDDFPDDVPSTHPAHPAGRRWDLGSLFVVTVLAFVVGSWGLDPYLDRQLQRVEPWKAWLISMGDFMSLGWFAFFVIRHSILGYPLHDMPWGEFRRQRVWQFALISFLLAFALDLTITLSLLYEDQALFTMAEVTTGAAEKVALSSEKFAVYLLQCRYQDRQGQTYTGYYEATLKPDHPRLPPAFPQPTVEALQEGRVPFPVRISYDPAWPARSWLTDVGCDGVNTLAGISLAIFFFQVCGLFLFAVVGERAVKAAPLAPWWLELHQVVPFLGQVVFLVFVGPAMRYKLWSLSML